MIEEEKQARVSIGKIKKVCRVLDMLMKLLLFDGCNYRSLLFSNPLFRGLFHF